MGLNRNKIIVTITKPEGIFCLSGENLHSENEMKEKWLCEMRATTKKGKTVRASALLLETRRREIIATVNSALYVLDTYGRPHNY